MRLIYAGWNILTYLKQGSFDVNGLQVGSIGLPILKIACRWYITMPVCRHVFNLMTRFHELAIMYEDLIG